MADVLTKFTRRICKFPHEWDKSTLEQRYHVIPETAFLTLMKEGDNQAGTYLSSKDYYPYYGRGLIQLTWVDAYAAYGEFRGFPHDSPTGTYHTLGWNPDTRIALNNTTFNAPRYTQVAG